VSILGGRSGKHAEVKLLAILRSREVRDLGRRAIEESVIPGLESTQSLTRPAEGCVGSCAVKWGCDSAVVFGRSSSSIVLESSANVLSGSIPIKESTVSFLRDFGKSWTSSHGSEEKWRTFKELGRTVNQPAMLTLRVACTFNSVSEGGMSK
jgi:hypothetical protein